MAALEQSCSNLPFGDQLNCTNSIQFPTEHHFTGKERDLESGLDYFEARYYSSGMGRFMSPDWASDPTAVPYATYANPQSLNLYNYMRNNPLGGVDPDGHCCDWSDVVNFAAGAANAWGSDNLAGAGRASQTTTAGQFGAAVGDFTAAVQGAGESLVGTGVEVGGVALDATGVGALIGVPANAAGAALIAHGAVTAGEGAVHLAQDASQTSGTYEKSPENQERMQQGKAPVGNDGKAVELHHEGQNANGQLKEMTQTEHRGGENFRNKYRIRLFLQNLRNNTSKKTPVSHVP